jgi:hypothetical protein
MHHTHNATPQAIANIEKGDDMGALLALSQLSSLLTGVPVLEAASQEVKLVAEELNSWAAVKSREKILTLMVQARDLGGGRGSCVWCVFVGGIASGLVADVVGEEAISKRTLTSKTHTRQTHTSNTRSRQPHATRSSTSPTPTSPRA